MCTPRSSNGLSKGRGSSPITRRASISSRIFMDPISAVKAEPERPAIMMDVSRTPSSLRTRMPMRFTTKVVAPKRWSWKMPCCEMMQPTRNEISTMMGVPRNATCSS